MADLTKKFNCAAKRIGNKDKYAGKGPSDDKGKLEIYALFKQAKEGDVTGSQPWAVQIEARAKWDAWNGKKGTSKESAMEQYVALINGYLGEPSDEELAEA